MASFSERDNKDGTTTYRVSIRIKDREEVYKSFSNKEDAELYAFYKERLLQNMNNFDVKLEDRITLDNIFDIKLRDSLDLDKKSLADFRGALRSLLSKLPERKYANEWSLDDWMKATKDLYGTDVYKGAKTDAGKRKMSISTLRKIIASASSVYSYAQSKGISIENHPLRVMQIYINPIMKSERNA